MEPILKKLEVTTTTVAALLILDLILDNEGFVTEVDSLLERSRNSVVSGLGLCYKTLVAFNDDSGRFFNLPLANIAEGFTANWSLLCGFRGCPPVCPILSELFKERCLDGSGLYIA